jgi:hypothetical protein
VLGEPLPRRAVVSAHGLQGRRRAQPALSQAQHDREEVNGPDVRAKPTRALRRLDQADLALEALDLGCGRFGLFETPPGVAILPTSGSATM